MFLAQHTRTERRTLVAKRRWNRAKRPTKKNRIFSFLGSQKENFRGTRLMDAGSLMAGWSENITRYDEEREGWKATRKKPEGVSASERKREREDVATPNFNSLITGARATSCRRSNISNYCVRKPLGAWLGQRDPVYIVYTRSCTPVPASRLDPSCTITRTNVYSVQRHEKVFKLDLS